MRIAHLALVAALLLAPSAATAQTRSVLPAFIPGAQGSLTVSGRGEVHRAPDRATIALTVVTNAPDAGRALSDSNRRFAALESKLTALGVPASAIDSSSLTSNFNPRPASGPIPAGVLFGYVVTRAVSVTIDSVDRAGTIVDAASAAGVAQVDGISFGLRDRAGAEHAALAAAVGDAQAAARAMAAAAHLELVRIASLEDASAPPSRIIPLMLARTAETPTTISPSDVSVARSVVITYIVRPTE